MFFMYSSFCFFLKYPVVFYFFVVLSLDSDFLTITVCTRPILNQLYYNYVIHIVILQAKIFICIKGIYKNISRIL